MLCHRLEHCCCCINQVLGIKLVLSFLTTVEIIGIGLCAYYYLHYLVYVTPPCSIGILTNIFAFIGLAKCVRWYFLPWLVGTMLVIVGSILASILSVVIPLGDEDPDWTEISIVSVSLFLCSALLLYFWIVLIEFFVRIGPSSLHSRRRVLGYPPTMYPSTSSILTAGSHENPYYPPIHF
eukprot:TRINITY_DN22900_c0_g1_i1.p1 TRINITY_DN22900_c0_g1~~TRINITY_DN22900_c0_g1_i1.p1  ORF type:complete len:180 (+),score=13.55 TRINITY_DN22900_c0_g1_i1:55-594(+)